MHQYQIAIQDADIAVALIRIAAMLDGDKTQDATNAIEAITFVLNILSEYDFGVIAREADGVPAFIAALRDTLRCYEEVYKSTAAAGPS